MIAQTLLIGAGLSMDAFAVSLCNGLTLNKDKVKTGLVIALFFGAFRAIMPMIGYFIGNLLEFFVKQFASYVALALLGFIGAKMLIEGIRKKDEKSECAVKESLAIPVLAVQAVATSIDALMVGVSFVAMGYNYNQLFLAAALIGGVTFVISFCGVMLGERFGCLLGNKAEIVGGIVLILIGLKVFLDGVGVL